MITTPIFNQLRAEMTEAPLCTICGRVNLGWFLDDLCSDCFQHNRDHPDAYREWHCHDCGEFIAGFDRMVFQTGRPYTVVFVCPEHFHDRQRGKEQGCA